MKIGLRTIKTALSATLSIIVASYIGLLYPASAGIISILSVTNTKKTSIKTGVYRLFSLALATSIAYMCFSILGFQAFSFGIFLLLFISSAVYFHLSDGIVVSSVLVSQYLVEKNISWSIITNEFLLMGIGVGFALLMNLYMPDIKRNVQKNQLEIDTIFRRILNDMAAYLNQHTKEKDLFKPCDELKEAIIKGEESAKRYDENHLLVSDNYYLAYFSMRRMQRKNLEGMLHILGEIMVEPEQVVTIQQVLQYTSETFSEENDGQLILSRIEKVYAVYRKKELPQTREEFENRAQLFHFLQLFKSLIEIKAEFFLSQKSND